MRVLVVGSGAREHAIAWKLRQSTRLSQMFVAPGNAGTASIAQNLPVPSADVEALAQAAREHRVDLTIVGPEVPLAEGIVDLFRSQGLAVFGPTKAAARIESSKVFSKALMQKHGIPTAEAQVFSSYEAARRYVMKHELPLVVKADGLAAGKGVFVCHSREEALEALHQCMEARAFGSAGDQVLVEECLQGREVSVFAFTDGTHLSPLVAACDYKRVGDGDQGPNTGGMGSYSPPEFWTDGLEAKVRATIMEPTVRAMAQEECPYQGVLYAGLMMTQEGPKVIEFNCRLGDPEAQVLLPRLKTDLLDLCLAVLEGRLQEVAVEWSREACVGVVLASQGYPADYPRGFPIDGLQDLDQNLVVFHAGTKLRDGGQAVTDGGRVLTVTALGRTLEEARQRVYRNVGRIQFEGAHYRRDIAVLTQATV
ncbi:MAG: phosphoribosylamine--glycine ligase [Dehalococcoidia bacterium]|nr:phosphoribosylamine--glycine ligase [Dehalococcoidia bacterium]